MLMSFRSSLIPPGESPVNMIGFTTLFDFEENVSPIYAGLEFYLGLFYTLFYLQFCALSLICTRSVQISASDLIH